MNNLLNKAIVLSLCLMVIFVSCDKDDDDVLIHLDTESLFFTDYNQTKTVNFTTKNVSTVEVSGKPGGWTVEADITTGILTITSPKKVAEVAEEEEEEDVEISLSGTITVKGISVANETGNDMMFVAIAGVLDLSKERSNSYIISDKVTNYHFDATKRGETDETLNISSAGIIWESTKGLLDNFEYNDGKVSFFIDQTDESEMIEGNAIIGAYDTNGDVIWSWHIWAVKKSVAEGTVSIGGNTFMSVNLGAFMSSNKTEEDILKSYGLYYQWGRKDPFVGPLRYNAAGARNANMYSGDGNSIQMKYDESTEVLGTQNYAVAHPLTFILGVEDTKYDWLYSTHSTTLWSQTKSINDPCPKGWRVPSSSELSTLKINDISKGTTESFGWNLTSDGGVTSSFFTGAGRRVYLFGSIQNIYNPLPESRAEAQPWEGLYWTIDSKPEAMASAFYFFYNDEDPSKSNVEPSVAHYRANGMQIRCVKM